MDGSVSIIFKYKKYFFLHTFSIDWTTLFLSSKKKLNRSSSKNLSTKIESFEFLKYLLPDASLNAEIQIQITRDKI